ncbi:MAG: M48 family metallopeptidase [Alphaproteobacteria bacterium]|nr:M48 family metallopeptidase [Alphaproteobacteria bacterium]
MPSGRGRKPSSRRGAFSESRRGAFSETVILDHGGRALPLRVRRNARARRVVLRVDAARDEAVLTLPLRLSLDEGLKFVRARGEWLAARLAGLPERVPFEDGRTIPLQGVLHRVRHATKRAKGQGVVYVTDGEIVVAGRPEHVSRRLYDWLRAEAKRVLEPLVRDKAARVGVSIRRVTVRDTRTLWGSCSASGDVSLCWRLILAPPVVADYVCAHEAAHLMVRGHGPRFWRMVEELAADMPAAHRWLAVEGETLQRYGPALRRGNDSGDEQDQAEPGHDHRAGAGHGLGAWMADLFRRARRRDA